MLENWLVKMTKQLCVSCKKEITNDPGSVIFICPACDKNKIIRCKSCREICAKYTCECGFTGPN